MIYDEMTIKSERIYEGKVVALRIDTIELPDQKYSKREIVEHNGGVCVIARNEEGKLILVRQYRKAASKALYEIPAGKLEPNEEPRETGMRELKEETGYSAKSLKYLMEFYPTPGYCTEKIYIFEADELVPGEQSLDQNEYLDVHYFTLDEAFEMVQRGEILDGKTIIAILYLKNKSNE